MALEKRFEFLVGQATLLAGSLINERSFDVEEMEAFANAAEERAIELDGLYTSKLDLDLDELTAHASSLRTLGGKIVALRDGIVPGLKIDRQSLTLRLQGVVAFAWIKTEFVAMENFIR